MYAIGASRDKLFQASIKETGYQENFCTVLSDPDRGSPLWGRIFGNQNLDIYEMLSRADLTCNMSSQKLGETQCYELRGKTALGNVTVLFSPEKGLAPLQWTIDKGPNDYFDNALLKELGIRSWKASCEMSHSKVGNFYVPIEGRMHFSIVYDNGKEINHVYEYKMSTIEIAPDFDALGAFEFDLPADVRVYLETAPGIIYNFRDGKLSPEMNQDFIAMLDDVAERIEQEVRPATVNIRTEKQEISTPVNALPAKGTEKKHFSMSVLMLPGIVFFGFCCCFLFCLIRRRAKNAKS